jgi:hypothetical protein
MNSKQVIASIGIAGSLLTGGVVDNANKQAQDALINPYTDTGAKLETRVKGNKVEVDKNEPKVTLHKWNGEANLTVKYGKTKKNGKTERKQLTKRAEYNVDGKETVVMDPSGDEEGFNIDIELSQKPDTNVFTYQLDNWEQFDFFYQPELTQEEKDQGAVRPDNVVGSYAVYHKTKKNHKVGGINYETGKAFHIYRPKAIDANGVERWAELNITDGVLTVTVPQEFLDAAAYPVIVDPTFGYTTAGASQGWTDDRDCGGSAASSFPLSENGTITSLSAYTKSVGDLALMGIWDNSGSSPATSFNSPAVATANYTPPSSPAWTTLSITETSKSAGTYWLGVYGQSNISNSANSTYLYYDSGGTGANSYCGSEWFGNDNKNSIYATYTAGGGSSAPAPAFLQFD